MRSALRTFVREMRPVAWLPTPAAIEQRQVLLLRLETLHQMERQEANRLENGRLDAQTRQDIQEHRQDLKIRNEASQKAAACAH